MAESENIVLVSCIIDFDDIQVWFRLIILNLNACKVMKAFLIFSESGQILKKTFITTQPSIAVRRNERLLHEHKLRL